jgi:oligopeptide transport system substrate-binding protein
MNSQMNTDKHGWKNKKISVSICVHLWIIVFALFLSSCNEIQSPKTEPFVSEKNAPPPKQIFRWSNGKMPKSLDPARAAAAPETDLVRALFEGLTDVEGKDLEPIPAVATVWKASADFKTWTFQLRQDAKWSNGEAVTAADFARSWQRLAELGDKVPQRQLLKNIVGMDTEDILPVFADEEIKVSDVADNSNTAPNPSDSVNSNTLVNQPSAPKVEKKFKSKVTFGVQAIEKFTLQVTLIHPDKDFPRLVAHPVFRPVYGDGKNFETAELSKNIVTNGAFVVSEIEKNGLTLERSTNFWNQAEIKLETVKFVSVESAEQALDAYRKGEIDAVSNANFAPLALKLLMTYKDLQKTKYSALSFYEFNLNKKPFDDARVREALAIAIERERLTEDEMDGATHPATNFLPFSESEKLKLDVEKAKKLLSEAGFPDGKDFPKIKLLINRNDLQRRIANSVKKMWEKHLNVEAEVVPKDKNDFQNAFQNGEFDLARRGVVLPTNDETANMLALFEKRQIVTVPKEAEKEETKPDETNNILNEKTAEANLSFPEDEFLTSDSNPAQITVNSPPEPILTEKEALEKLPAIPLYFPMSFSLIKPYVRGFETNLLDAHSLKKVDIDNHWQESSKK